MTRARIAAAVAAVVAVCVFAGLAIGAGDGGNDRYLVRAVFDNSSFVIPGEDVKIAGVKVGKIDSLDLTKDNKAVVVLDITDPAFQSFKTDARCRIALQSLIGEQFVDCQATAGGNDGRAKALPEIEDGAGKGEHLLPVSQNTTPVGVDLLNNIMRVPQRDRFKLIINELGAGLAANGESLRKAVRRANPALQQLDKVVAILARQNEMLGKLTDDSDTVLGPMAAHRKDLGGFVDTAGKTAVATAEQGDALEQNFAKLPAFLQSSSPPRSASARWPTRWGRPWRTSRPRRPRSTRRSRTSGRSRSRPRLPSRRLATSPTAAARPSRRSAGSSTASAACRSRCSRWPPTSATSPRASTAPVASSR